MTKPDARRKVTWARVVRIFEDGLREVEQSNGRRYRAYFYRCEECQEEMPAEGFPHIPGTVSSRAAICHQCQNASHKEWVEEQNRIHEPAHKMRMIERAIAWGRKRAGLLCAAKPSWVDRAALAEIYREARSRTQAEGVQYHVDHIWPIQHPLCCGLHVPWNLRVIPASENCSKGNGLMICEKEGLRPLLVS